jgi:hypothetical protein
MVFARVSTWILVSGIAMLGIIFIVTVSKWIGSKNVPVVSPVANGMVAAWKAAA